MPLEDWKNIHRTPSTVLRSSLECWNEERYQSSQKSAEGLRDLSYEERLETLGL